MVVELHFSVFYSLNKPRVSHVLIWTPARMTQDVAFFCKARAQIGVHVLGHLLASGLITHQQDVVVVILNVPVVH